MLDAPTIERIQALDPRPGDCFVLPTTGNLSLAQVERIRDQVKDVFPVGCKVAVLDGGMKFEQVAAPDFSLLMGACI